MGRIGDASFEIPMSNRFEFLRRELAALEVSDSLRRLRRWPDPDGRGGGGGEGELISFASNDYLGLAAERWAGSDACPRGAGASPLVSGYTELHDRLCRMLAQWEQAEAAVVLPSGYAACCGVVATLPRAGDLILSDRWNHASLIDGCRLSKAEKRVYPHADLAAVEATLIRHRHEFEQVWIVTDGVFGMDGDIAPLEGLCDLADRHDAIMVVDEAHGSGVLGEDGSGACEDRGVRERVPIRIGTLSKAVGSQGGFVVGPQTVIDYLVNFCRPLIFSTAASPLVIATAIDGIRAIREEPWRRQRVRELARRVRGHLSPVDEGDSSGCVPIIPIILGSNHRAVHVAKQARQAGLFIPAIRPPTVPAGTARLRISLSATHRADHIDRLLRFLNGLPEVRQAASGNGQQPF